GGQAADRFARPRRRQWRPADEQQRFHNPLQRRRCGGRGCRGTDGRHVLGGFTHVYFPALLVEQSTVRTAQILRRFRLKFRASRILGWFLHHVPSLPWVAILECGGWTSLWIIWTVARSKAVSSR